MSKKDIEAIADVLAALTPHPETARRYACEICELFEARTQALSFLVHLKDLKDTHGKDEYYLSHKEVAWRNAKEALKDE